MPNPYVNKVVQSNGTTIIDISDTTAVAGDVTSGKYIYLASGQKVAGTKEDDVLTTKTITLNGTYDPDDDSADGYSEVTVNVQGGASMTETPNQYGTELVITSAPSSAPSATRHTLYFEYEDESTETVYAYYDDAFIGSAITATTPTTHNSKTVTSAQLDGVEWYSYTPTPTPSGNWVTVFDGTLEMWEDKGYIYELADLDLSVSEKWRVTINGTSYECDTEYSEVFWSEYLGNEAMYDDTTATGQYPFLLRNGGGGAVIVAVRNGGSNDYPFKLEKQVTS